MSRGETESRVLERLRDMDPYDFEHFVAELWEAEGWQTEVSQASNDKGVDIVASRSDGLVDQKVAMQVKRYAEDNRIGRPDMQQYLSLKHQQTDIDAVVVVTTSSFNSNAEEYAAEQNMKLVDGQDLVSRVLDGHQDLLNKYAPVESRNIENDGATPDSGKADSPKEKVDEIRSILNNPDDGDEWIDQFAWKYMWMPEDDRAKAIGGTVAGCLVLFALLGNSVGETVTGAVIGLLLGGIGVGIGTHKIKERGQNLITKYHGPIYEYATSDIRTQAQSKLGTTGPNVTTYVIERTEQGDELASVPRKYQIVTLVLDNSSMGVIESGWISVPKVSHNSGRLTQEFFYDQVTRLNRENGELVLYLTDGSEHSWEAKNLSNQAMQDIRDRIRAYK